MSRFRLLNAVRVVCALAAFMLAFAAGAGAAFAFGGACRAMLLCGVISMSAGSFFAVFAAGV